MQIESINDPVPAPAKHQLKLTVTLTDHGGGKIECHMQKDKCPTNMEEFRALSPEDRQLQIMMANIIMANIIHAVTIADEIPLAPPKDGVLARQAPGDSFEPAGKIADRIKQDVAAKRAAAAEDDPQW